MSESPDQHLIHELVRNLRGEGSTKGSNDPSKHTPSGLSDEEIISLCRKAKNAPKFASLYDDGNTSGNGSASEADAALLAIMAFFTQDAEQLERLWGVSALGQRTKFRRADYRRRTIDYVL